MPKTAASTPARSVTWGDRMNVRTPANLGMICASSGLYGGPVTGLRYRYSTSARNRFVRSWLGEEKNVSGGASSITFPSSIIRIELAT